MNSVTKFYQNRSMSKISPLSPTEKIAEFDHIPHLGEGEGYEEILYPMSDPKQK